MQNTTSTQELDRIAVLKEIMMRTDLSAAELRICAYLLLTRMNPSGNCFCSDKFLADTLRVQPSTIYRAKHSLRKKKVLTWTHQGQLHASTHVATDYRFISTLKGLRPRSEPLQPNAGSLPAPTQVARRPPKHGDRNPKTGEIFAGLINGAESPELQRADLDERRTGNPAGLPRHPKTGGWWVHPRYFSHNTATNDNKTASRPH